MTTPLTLKSIALGLFGAIVGGAVGHFVFQWILRQGFHAIMIPPACLGFGAGYFAGTRSQALAIAAALAGLGLGLLTEWRFFPFLKDESFSYFVTHIHELKPIVLGLLALGTFLCYRLARGLDSKSSAS